MTPELFRDVGIRMLDEINDYFAGIEQHPVQPTTKPGEVAAQIGSLLTEDPGTPDTWHELLYQVRGVVIPNTMHWQSPAFFGYFPCNTSAPAILGELLCAGLGGQGMLWQTAPAANEIERVLLDQMAEAMRLPSRFMSSTDNGGGCIQPTASDSTLASLVAARRRVLETSNADSSSITVHASSQAHSSVVKAAMIAGLARTADDRSRVRLIDTDAEHRLDPEALRAAIERDIAEGLTPAYVCATVGTTGVTAVDPVDRIAGVMRETGIVDRGAWLHVDAAHAGPLLLCDEFRWMAAGLEHADSLCLNPHKWMLTTFDCDLFWTADRKSLVDSLSITPEYLRNDATEAGAVFDYRDWGVPLGRRFRALKLWFVLRWYGLSGIRAYLLEHVRLAELIEQRVLADNRFELLAPRTMNLVCFGLRSGNRPTADLMARVNSTGRAFLTHTTIPMGDGADRYAIRMAIGATTTEERHVTATWDLIARVADPA